MSACAVALSEESILAYLAGELAASDEDQFEQHYFGCESCSKAVESLASLTAELREVIPPVLTAAHLDRLRTAMRIRETQVLPGQPMEAWFAADLDLLVHALHADLEGVHRVDLEVLDARDQPFMSVLAVPFDPETGVVYVACQRHFQGTEPVEDTRFRLLAAGAGGSRVLGDFVVRHHWPV